MGIVVRQSLKNTLISYLGVFVGFINSILLFPHILNSEQLGLYALILQIGVLYYQISSAGTVNSILKYFPKYRNTSQTSHFLYGIFLFALVGFVLFTLVYVVLKPFMIDWFSEKSNLFFHFYELAIPLAFSILLFGLISAILRTLHHTVLATFCRDLLQKVITMILLLLFSWKVISFEMFLYGLIVNYLILTLIGILFLIIRNPSHFKNKVLIKRRELIGILRYGLYTMLGGISEILYRYIDLIMIAMLLSLSAVGIYSRAVYLVAFITVPARALFQISHPIVAENQVSENVEELEVLYKKSSVNIFLASSLLFILLWINRDFVFGLMPEEYAAGILPFLFLGIGRLFDATCGINFQIMITSKYYRVDTVFNLVLVLAMIGLNLWLIPIYGMKGAAIATMITFIVINLFRVIYLALRMNIHPISTELLLAFGIALVALTVGSFLPSLGKNWIDLFYKSVVITAVFGLLFWFTPGFSDAKGLMTSALARLRIKD